MGKKISAGFIGAGGIARSHAFALNSLKFYYNDAPDIELVAVSSETEKSRASFASRFGFDKYLSPGEFFANQDIDTVYILGPNKVHFDHLDKAVGMHSVKRIYIEKPLCSTAAEEKQISAIAKENSGIKIQAGFQFLFMTAIKEALKLWNTGVFGKPVHFDLKYYHGDYLQKQYRDKRANRLTPAPDGGAMADLGSHAISLLTAFLGPDLKITGAIAAGSFTDVHPDSDLFSLISIKEGKSGAAGTVAASRVASGTGDLLSMELYSEKGSLRFSSHFPDYFEYYLEETGTWNRVTSGGNYVNITSFPSGHVPPGWLRSMIHAHYVFLTGNDPDAFVPDVAHALEVQRLVRETAGFLKLKNNE